MNNEAHISGGVFQFHQTGGTIELLDSIFENNTSYDSGVMDINTEYNTYFIIFNCNFNNNYANYGGVLNIIVGNIIFNKIISFQNEAIHAAFIYSGGYSEIKFENTIFINTM